MFFIGAIFVRDHNLKVENVFIAILSIFYASYKIGSNAIYLLDLASAKQSAAKLFLIIDSEDEDQQQIK